MSKFNGEHNDALMPVEKSNSKCKLPANLPQNVHYLAKNMR